MTDRPVDSAAGDVLVVVLAGGGEILVDGETHDVRALHALLVRKGATRRITAGPEGLRYLSVHLRRPGLMP